MVHLAGWRGKALAVAVLPLIVLAGTSTAAQATPPAGPGATVFLTVVPGQTFKDAFADLAVNQPQQRELAGQVLKQLGQTLAGGNSAGLPGVSGIEAQQAELLKAQAALVGTYASSPMFWSGRWPIRGGFCGIGCWRVSFNINGYTCGSTCTLTDKVDGYVTANYGGVTSMLFQHALYFPNAGHFHNIHYQLWPGTANGGNDFDSEDSMDGPWREGSFDVTSPVEFWAKGQYLAFNLALWLDAPGGSNPHPGHHAGTQWMYCSSVTGDNTCN
jgi:hypothetical protein